jgi:excisionase family DNA binding protein
MNDPLMNVREVARQLGVHENTVRNMADDGRLPVGARLPGSGYRRFKREDVERMHREMWSQFAPDTAMPAQATRPARGRPVTGDKL